MSNYYKVPVATDQVTGVYDYGLPLYEIEASILDGLNPPQFAFIKTEATLTGAAITEAQFAAGFPAADPAVLLKLDFVGLLQSAGGMTAAQYAAFIADQSPAIMQLKFELGLVEVGMQRDNAMTAGALAELVTAGYLPGAGPAAVIAAWPSAADYAAGK
jgi:hypothetical protein